MGAHLKTTTCIVPTTFHPSKIVMSFNQSTGRKFNPLPSAEQITSSAKEEGTTHEVQRRTGPGTT